MTAEDRAAHVEREAVAGVLAGHATFGWNGDRHHACRCGAHLNDKTWADPLPRWALHVADAVLAALPQTGDAAAVPNGIDPDRYHEGDVNHVLQPVIGWLRLDLAAGKPLSAERVQTVIDRMYQACESERQWLAALTAGADQ